MPTARRKTPGPSERSFQQSVLYWARIRGWKVCHFHDSRRQVRPGQFVGDADAAGYPDLTLCRGTRLMFAELKAETGKVTVTQQEWIEGLRLTGAEVHVWKPSDWPVIEETLR